MRTLTALLAASVLIASAGCAVSATRVPLRRGGATVLPITQIRTMFPVGSAPIKIESAGTPPEGVAMATSTGADSSTSGSSAYKTGSGVALTPTSLSNPDTGSALLINYVMLESRPPSADVYLQFPAAAEQVSTFPIVSAFFGQLPQSQHLYTFTMQLSAWELTSHLRVKIGSQEFSGNALAANGDTIATTFVYNAGGSNRGTLSVNAYWDHGNPLTYASFYSLQLVQLD